MSDLPNITKIPSELEKKLTRLVTEHRTLDDEIQALIELHSKNEMEIKRLKRQKLLLKDKIERIKSELIPNLLA